MASYNTNLYISQYDANQHLEWQEKIKHGYDSIEKISKNLDEMQAGLKTFQKSLEEEIHACHKALNTINMNLDHYEGDEGDYASKLRALQRRYQTVYELLTEVEDFPVETLKKINEAKKAFNKDHYLRELKLHEATLNQFHFEQHNPMSNEYSNEIAELSESLDTIKQTTETHRDFVMQTELNLHVQNKQFMQLQEQLKTLNSEVFYS